MWLVKTNSTGSEDWSTTFDRGDDDSTKSVQQTADGGYIVAGTTYNDGNHDMWLVKVKENHDLVISSIDTLDDSETINSDDVEETDEAQEESESTPGFSMIPAIGMLL
jgi:hypothetical protein